MPLEIKLEDEPLANQATMPAAGIPAQIAGQQASTAGAVAGEALTEAIPPTVAMGASFIPGVGQAGLLGRVAVAGASGAGGDFIRRGVNKILGIDAAKDKRAVLSTALEEGTEQAAFQVLGEAGAAGLRIGARGVNKVLGPFRVAAQDALNKAVRETSQKFGLDLTAPEIANSSAGKMIQGIIEKRVAGGEIAQTRRLNLYGKAVGAINKTLDDIGPSTSHMGMGQMVRDTRKIAEENWRATEGTMYDEVLKLAGNTRVSIVNARKTADAILKPAGEAAQDLPSVLGADPRVKRTLKDLTTKNPMESVPYYDKLSPEVQAQLKSELPQQLQDLSLDDALRVRSALLAKIRSLDKYKDRGAIADFSAVVDDVQKSIEGSLSGDALDAWKAAREWTSTGHDIFQRGLVAKSMAKNPEEFIHKTKLDSPQDIQMAKEVILTHGKDRKTWDAFSRGVITDKIIGPPGKEGFLDLAGISGRIRAADPDALRILVSNDPKAAIAIQNLSKVADAMERVKNATPGLAGSFEAASDMNRVISMAMALGAGSVSGLSAKAATTLVPATLAKILYNPKATNAMLDGIKILGKSRQVPQLSGKAVSNFIRASQIAADVFTEVDRRQNGQMEALRASSAGGGGVAITPVE